MASDPTSEHSPRELICGERKSVRMGKFEVVKHIANGGMGTVYRARDTEAGRDVALKVLPKDMAEKPLMLERFKREAKSAAKLRHENIVTLYEAGEIQGTFYLAMEFVEGIDLYDQVKRHGLLHPEEARLIVLQAAHALRHAHKHGIVHRDIKPSNFLLRWEGGQPVVKLLDFGLARELDDDQSRVTRAGTTVGTIDYMPPEQARDSGAADTRSDMYSLGATWFYLLSGQALFPGGGLGERLLRLMQDEPPDLRDLNPAVSDETWDIVRRLLTKDPLDRYQTPDELMEALEGLEGHAAADPRRSTARNRRVASVLLPLHDDPRGQGLWYLLAGAAAFLLLGAVTVALSMPRRPPALESVEAPAPPPELLPLPRAFDTPVPKHDGVGSPAIWTPPLQLRPLRALPSARDVDALALREEIERHWAAVAAPIEPLTVRVGRAVVPSPIHFRTLNEACKATAAGQPLVVEIHDNGPLFEHRVDAVEGRDLTIRAGPGFRPLIVWDTRPPRGMRKADPPQAFLTVRGGRLALEGVELALRCSEMVPRSAPALLDVEDGELSVRDCTLSVAGKPAGGATLARFAAKKGGARCRLTRCQMRGASVTALSLSGPAEALLDGCLVAGGARPLLRLGEKRCNLRLVGSTLIGERLLETAGPASVFAWDSLLRGGDDIPGVTWHAVNCVYAGWKHLPSSAEAEAVVSDPWPEQTYNEPATLPAATYQPTGPVLFASTIDARKPLGCDLAALPPCRDAWVTLALDPLIPAPEPPSDDAAPEIPTDDEGRYAGGVIDVASCDLGAVLAKVKRFAPRVVLHLKGSGEVPTSPIRLKGVNLVLHFEPPSDRKTPPLALTLRRAETPVPLIQLDGGSLEVLGGVLRVPDESSQKASHVVRVVGGDARFYRTRIEGPKQEYPEGYVAAVAITGSGDPAPEKGHAVAANECVFLSSKAAVLLDGVGSRASLRQCVVVAGEEGLRLLPGKACKGRCGMGATLANVTFACRRSVVHLADATAAGVPVEPAVVQARNCAYLNPFPGKPSKAGLLTWDGDALRRGLLVWHGDGEGIDRRLHFAAASGPIGDAREAPFFAWCRLWGVAGARNPRDLPGPLYEFAPRRWSLEQLALRFPGAPGANLERLGLAARKPR